MGTNYYVRGFNGSYKHHVGKRSAAGLYCWDCGITLCKEGPKAVHQGMSDWHKACPKCGKTSDGNGESITKGAAARELGFDKSPPARKKGVASCSSFSWGIEPDKVPKTVSALEDPCHCPTCKCSKLYKDGKVIENEYGDLFTYKEFQAILLECPIQSFDYIGKDFS